MSVTGLASRVTIESDGDAPVNILGDATVRIAISNADSLGGQVIVRMKNGRAIKQTNWTARKYQRTFTFSGRSNPVFTGIAWEKLITITVPWEGGSTVQYTGFVRQAPTESPNHTTGWVAWNLVLEDN